VRQPGNKFCLRTGGSLQCFWNGLSVDWDSTEAVEKSRADQCVSTSVVLFAFFSLLQKYRKKEDREKGMYVVGENSIEKAISSKHSILDVGVPYGMQPNYHAVSCSS